MYNGNDQVVFHIQCSSPLDNDIANHLKKIMIGSTFAEVPSDQISWLLNILMDAISINRFCNELN